ncbi:hypothetical protein GGR57DRAFT_497939 [Xylariaceae sp. FL1272]|nr:hypothetical protein GGR57DRAFT_497939 [Xylariaceae sp. FL1272]
MSATKTQVPFWSPATYEVSIVAACPTCGKDHESILDEATWVQAWDIRDAFAALKRDQPLHISTTMKDVGFPAITLADVERWANADGTFGPGTQAHDASDLSAQETLRQLERCANKAMTLSNPGRLGQVLLATEAQQKSLVTSWPEYRKINQEQGRWVSSVCLDAGESGCMQWWTRACSKDTRGADQELSTARRTRIAKVLVPFIAAWRAGSRAHTMSSAVCKGCM